MAAKKQKKLSVPFIDHMGVAHYNMPSFEEEYQVKAEAERQLRHHAETLAIKAWQLHGLGNRSAISCIAEVVYDAYIQGVGVGKLIRIATAPKKKGK